MNIRVINLKNLSSYFLKVGVLLIIAAIFGKFFYNNRGVNASLKIDSSKFSKILNKEISLFNNTNKVETSSNNYIYSKMALDSELGLIKVATNQNLENMNANLDTNLNAEKEIEITSAQNSEENKNNTTLSNNQDANDGDKINQQLLETFAEPEVRPKCRNFTIKCAR